MQSILQLNSRNKYLKRGEVQLMSLADTQTHFLFVDHHVAASRLTVYIYGFSVHH